MDKNKSRIAILLALVGFVSVSGIAVAGEQGWIPLFDGTSLDGWSVKCRPSDKDKQYWKVEDGAITAEVPEESKHHYIWLLHEQEFGDFELKLNVQTLAAKGNSGVQVRSRYDDEAGWLDGPQVDIHPPGPWRSGFIYDETREYKQWVSPIVGKPNLAKPIHAAPGWTWQHANGSDAWNDVHIICRGTRIQSIINGVTVCDYDGAGYLDDDVHRVRKVGLDGHIALQIHPGGGLRIRFKEIRVKPVTGMTDSPGQINPTE